MCSSPTAGVLYLFRERNGTSELLRLPLSDATGAECPRSSQAAFRWCPTTTAMSPPTVQRLLYTRRSEHANIWRLDLRGAAPATSLTRGTSMLGFPRVSPDGQWIVATQGTESDPRIVKIPIGGGEPVQLAAGGAAVWSPDGRRLAFVSSLVSAAQRDLDQRRRWSRAEGSEGRCG